MVTTALARLDLPAERQAALLPLVQSGVDARTGAKPQDAGLDAHAKKLTRIDRDKARSFAEFSAFDLALDPPTVATLDGIRDAIGASDVLLVQLDCLLRLVRLEPEPGAGAAIRRSLHVPPRSARGEQRWQEMAALAVARCGPCRRRASNHGQTSPKSSPRTSPASARSTAPPGSSSSPAAAPKAAWRPARSSRPSGPPPGRRSSTPSGRKPADTKDSRAAVQLLCDHALLVAPALAAALDGAEHAEFLQRAIARVLGFAGHGYEVPLGKLLDSRDEQTVRESLRSLARIGTPRAAALVGAQVFKNRDWVGSAAEETLWHFPRTESDRQIRDLLGRREFVLRQPQAAGRLLDRAAQSGAANLAPILQTLVPLRYRFWNPALVRVARQARTMLTAPTST